MMTLQMCEDAAMAAIAFRTARSSSDPTQAATFRPLDPDVVSAAIPSFFIGRNGAGLWVARDVHGRIGGLFLFGRSAIAFAKRQSRPRQCALVFPTETFELDIENRGNPLIVLAGHARRLLARMTSRR